MVKLDLTQEIEVFYIMFDRSLPIFTMTYSIKSSIKNTLNFRCKIQPDHTLYMCRTAYLGLGVTPSSNALHINVLRQQYAFPIITLILFFTTFSSTLSVQRFVGNFLVR